jgi:XTP/dITP diphosphohydrolase
MQGLFNEINIATKNEHKVREANIILKEFGIKLKQVDAKYHEIQSDSLAEIAKFSAVNAAKSLDMPIVTEDSGLFISSLNGFPGPYSSYVYKTLGTKGIIKLLEGINNRSATFVSCVAYAKPNGFCKVFEGKVKGNITCKERGSKGFGFDPIFVPNGLSKTFAEMSKEEKCKYSHRAYAFKRFGNWYTSIK